MPIKDITNIKPITIKKQELSAKLKQTYVGLKFDIETEEGKDSDYTRMLIVYHNQLPSVEKETECIGMKIRSLDAFCYNNQQFDGYKSNGEIKAKKGFATFLENIFELKKVKVSKKAKKTQKTSLYEEMFGK